LPLPRLLISRSFLRPEFLVELYATDVKLFSALSGKARFEARFQHF